MSDKVQLIKQEIERLIAIEEETTHLDKLSFNSGRWKALTKVKVFIDSLPEEPGCEIDFITKSEDLEEEIERCWKEMFPIGWSDKTLLTLTYEQLKAFAHHFAEWQRQQMFRNAQQSEIYGKFGETIAEGTTEYGLAKLEGKYKVGDKVRLIVLPYE